MADDGMLMNFDLGDGPLVVKPTFKGGRWKDRLTAKKAAAHRAKRSSDPKPAVDGAPSRNAGDNRDPRPNKRQRVDDEFRPANAGHKAGQNAGQNAGKNGAPRQFISSLFTFNPESTTKTEVQPEQPQDGEEVQPSNAPLSPELENFTSLGLSTQLANHMLNKMQIKAPTAIQKAAISQLVKDNSDAFIQAQTGSGKTLAYLLPIVQRLIAMGDKVHRDSGLFAIVLAPTRELSKQISVVLENVLRCAHWIVPGTVIGGEKKKSEKARVRKGLNILVATPGRLADHLEHTEALDVSNVRWLVLDEGDRLMELGFENEIQKIVGTLNLRMKAARARIPGLPEKRMTILCSATMKMDVQRLGEISLKEAVHIQADPKDKNEEEDTEMQDAAFSAPAQLKQSYAVVPAKLRLVTLIAVLKRAFARRGSVMKVIVFISCADSVEFHFEVLARGSEEEGDGKEKSKENAKVDAKADTKADTKADAKVDSPQQDGEAEDKAEEKTEKTEEKTEEKDDAKKRKRDGKPRKPEPPAIGRTSAPASAISSKENPVNVYKLHGSLPQAVRTSTLSAFTHSKDPAVLVCTDVASRGLDLPNVDFVIEYDPAFAKDDHLHRIGRTARAGRDGRSLLFLMPGDEEGYTQILKDTRADAGATLTRHDAPELLRKAFTPPGTVGSATKHAYEDAATEWQLDLERWALANPAKLELARRGYQSHIRAYATHVAAERVFFNIKTLHLGHLAKAFALRDRPASIRVPGLRPGADSHAKGKEDRRAKARAAAGRGKGAAAAAAAAAWDADEIAPTKSQIEADEAARKMRKKMRMVVSGGASEFNLG
ncbi:uncharacterized protein K452DRAFT_285936 [Aplosporella prunicola CBS 121167]|uniref:ATP-dependent RNA helicase n=1 Tax=Aplosporella prunicola CBS 121167 TaxID=1176127 RepID=A0A6A6BJU3_9PEZI|nr:uncharacterized protein K452DRAFT_285936 [Aplosporella prunicola CBS 121167]KAF2143898.1 hypothetical protein K452DRAFT_285936 [Aplosporella prunicola CBS 121167]